MYIHIKPFLNLWREKYINKNTGYVRNIIIHDMLALSPGFISASIPKKIACRTLRCTVFKVAEAPKELLKLLSINKNKKGNKKNENRSVQ